MAVPPFHAFLHPMLAYLGAHSEARFAEILSSLATDLNVTTEEQAELLPSGKQRRFANRVGWARTYLVKAGLAESPKRGSLRITPRGMNALSAGEPITLDFLKRYAEFNAFALSTTTATEGEPSTPSVTDSMTPDEQIESLMRTLDLQLANELLNLLLSREPSFFEQVVVQLLVRMGYGGAIEDAGQVVGRSGDGGIDGVIKQDPLGLDKVHVQAKRYALERTVGSSDVRNLAGALQVHKANKGILITTSDFTRDALETANQVGSIVLINGQQLTRLMIKYDLGVTTQTTHYLKHVDLDYFEL